MTDETEARFRRRLETLIGIAATEGNDLRKLRNGDEIFPAMLEAVNGAQNTVDLLTYVYWRGDIAQRFAETLSAAARRGVRVRLLIDAVGGFQIDRALVRQMEDAGVSFQWFRKPWLKSPFKQNHRTHRKCLIVDETVGFTGGVGIADEWDGDAQRPDEWRDTHVRVEGPAVDGIAAAFAQNWAESGLPLFDRRDAFPSQKSPGDSIVQVVRSSASVGWDDLQTLFTVLVTSAQQRVRITTAYFAPSTDFVELLIEAAQRGVEVDVLLPGPHADKRVCQIASESEYADLTEGGVTVWNFQPSMLHAKICTVDQVVSVVGSSNFNRRSMDHDEEVVMAVIDRDFTAELDADFEDDLKRSRKISLVRWEDRGLAQRAKEKAVRPIRRWL